MPFEVQRKLYLAECNQCKNQHGKYYLGEISLNKTKRSCYFYDIWSVLTLNVGNS